MMAMWFLLFLFFVGLFVLVYLVNQQSIDIWILSRYQMKLFEYKNLVSYCLINRETIPKRVIKDVDKIESSIKRIREKYSIKY